MDCKWGLTWSVSSMVNIGRRSASTTLQLLKADRDRSRMKKKTGLFMSAVQRAHQIDHGIL
ncbi:hypothetical protein Ciccas_013798 [Cichlidogyrus casuarinus]|uniref:Uncharacterized protein n=1 Tax=Cichlidogyrus casuarinus TaxID=1844966 RepID=A0ABD2PL48_9PLAT